MATLATGYGPYGHYKEETGALKSNLGNIMKSGKFYVTPEICREVKHIDTGVSHLRLDDNLLSTSKDWASKTNDGTLPLERSAAKRMMNTAKRVTFDVMDTTNTRNTIPMLDNEKREIHHWTVETLKGMEKEMGPFVHSASDRIRSFSDHVGVTDRYTGYRHNLNRVNRSPVNQGHRWLDTKKFGNNMSHKIGWKSDPSSNYNSDYAPRPAARSAPPGFSGPPTSAKQTSGTVESLYPSHVGIKQAATAHRTIQEKCGIVVPFPGRTEVMDRYKTPSLDRNTLAFTINPTPDFSLTGRPLLDLKLSKRYSECQSRYQWPDGRLIDTKPWLRK